MQADPDALARDIEDRWEVLGEAVQTVMRRYGVPEPYQKLKELTRGQVVDQKLLHDFIQSLEQKDWYYWLLKENPNQVRHPEAEKAEASKSDG